MNAPEEKLESVERVISNSDVSQEKWTVYWVPQCVESTGNRRKQDRTGYTETLKVLGYIVFWNKITLTLRRTHQASGVKRMYSYTSRSLAYGKYCTLLYGCLDAKFTLRCTEGEVVHCAINESQGEVTLLRLLQ